MLTSPSTLTKEQYKSSNYNFFIKYDSDTYYGYNFLYRSIVRVSSRAFGSIQHFLVGTPPGHTEDDVRTCCPDASFEALRSARFLIERTRDELSLIRFTYFRNLFSSHSVHLVILPTLRCNFNCPYCFELDKSTVMNSDVERALYRWVEETFVDSRLLSVAWFGGEPLLRKSAIIRLSERFQSFCSRVGARYQSSLITNGFLFDPPTQELLPSLGIEQVQITLDGDQETHDKTRQLTNGRGSFDRIYENILHFCKNTGKCLLTLRVNCGDSNFAGVEKLLTVFPPEVKSRVTIFFRWLWANEATGYREFSSLKRGTAPYEGLAHLYKTAQDLGWHTKNPLGHIWGGYCELDRLNHFQVGPDGSVFLCTNTYKSRDRIGSVFDRSGSIGAEAFDRYVGWYAAQPFDDPQCIECKLLPVCFGGCRRNRIEGCRACVDEAGSIELYVRNLVTERINNIQA